MPDYSTFCQNSQGRFRDSDLLRPLFGIVFARCIIEGFSDDKGFAAHACSIKVNADWRKGVEGHTGERASSEATMCI